METTTKIPAPGMDLYHFPVSLNIEDYDFSGLTPNYEAQYRSSILRHIEMINDEKARNAALDMRWQYSLESHAASNYGIDMIHYIVRQMVGVKGMIAKGWLHD